MSIKTVPNSIVHPSGHKMVMLGGDVYEQHKVGDLIVELKWVEGEPVMLLYKNVLGQTGKAFMIEFKDAYRFARSDGYASKELVQKLSHDAARALNSEHDKATCYRIITAIMDFMPDLLLMPPEPTEQEKANRPVTGDGELTIKIDGKVILETEL